MKLMQEICPKLYAAEIIIEPDQSIAGERPDPNFVFMSQKVVGTITTRSAGQKEHPTVSESLSPFLTFLSCLLAMSAHDIRRVNRCPASSLWGHHGDQCALIFTRQETGRLMSMRSSPMSDIVSHIDMVHMFERLDRTSYDKSYRRWIYRLFEANSLLPNWN